jgi:lysophospholipase L1-like esterase
MSYITSIYNKISLATTGHTIAQQRAVFESTPFSPSVPWLIMQVGLNDLDPAEAASVAIARLQGLVTSAQAILPPASKVFVAQMTPCKARLITIYGAVNGPIAYQKWFDMNTAIAGGGATPITGADGAITAHVALLNDGSGNLAAAYDLGDGIHENNDGRQIIATAWTDALTAAGVTI